VVQHQVRQIYEHNPMLLSRYPPINSIPLTSHLTHTTKKLREWLQKINHQIKITKNVHSSLKGLPTIREAFQRVQYCNEHDNV